MKKLVWSLVLALFFVVSSIFITSIPAEAQTKKCIYFFYGTGCPHCGQVKPYLAKLEDRYSDLEIREYEVYSNRENSYLLQDFFEYFQISQYERGVPIVFVGDEYIIGDTPIMSMAEEYLVTSDEIKCISVDVIQGKESGSGTQDEEKKKTSPISVATIIGAALVDSINPCAIAVLLILLGSLALVSDKIRALKSGIAFIVAIFIAYFLFGLGLLTFIENAAISYWLYKVIGVLAILIGLWNIKDYFWYKVGPNIEIPKRFRPSLKNLLGRVTSPVGAFLIGFVVCLFELPCTGGPYLFALSILAEKGTAQTIPILLLYNLFFVVPLLVILLLIYYGFASVEKAKKWQEKNTKKLHLVAGILMLALGIVVILGLV